MVVCAAGCGRGAADSSRFGAQTGTGTPAATPVTQALIEPYLKIQASLSADSLDGVASNAGRIATAASSLGAPAVKIDTAALRLASAGDLADARAKFGDLSEAIVNYMTGQHLTLPAGVREADCWMVRKPWLQQGSTLANPYYGTEMANCGEFRPVPESRAAPPPPDSTASEFRLAT